MVWVGFPLGTDSLVNEGSALCVQRASDVPESDVDGSEKQAAVELIDRCLSSRAVWPF